MVPPLLFPETRVRLPSPLVCLVVLASCAPARPRTVEIVAVNYAFQAPDSLPAGPAVFRLTNHGTVVHEVQLFRFRRGIAADSGLRLLAATGAPDSLFDASGAVLVSAVGATAIQGVTADLRPGELWALVCQFRDSAGTPQHDKLGMFKVLTVTGARD